MKYKIQLFIVSMLFIQTAVKAQEMVAMVAKLTDDEIRVAIPILKAEFAGQTKIMNGMQSEMDQKYQLFLDIQSGKTDPLVWLKQHSKHILVPPAAKYLPACSREASVKGWKNIKDEAGSGIKPSAVPTAIFSYGIDFPAINKQLLGNNITIDSYIKFCDDPYNVNDPSVEKMKSVVREAYSFYTKNGFSADYGMSSGSSISFYHPEDEGNISGFVSIFDWSLLDPLYQNVIKQCRSYIMGPVIEISPTYEFLNKIFRAPDISQSVDENTKNNLRKAGITEDRYALIKGSLLRVRTDSENPDAIEIPSFDFTPTTQEEKEIAKTIEMMKNDALARKGNITIYLKFKAELDPIIDALEKQTGGVY